MRKRLIVQGGQESSGVELIKTCPLDISANLVFVKSRLQQRPSIPFDAESLASRRSSEPDVCNSLNWPFRIERWILRNKTDMLNSTWHLNQDICSQSGCIAASRKLEVFPWLNSKSTKSKVALFNVCPCHYRGNLRHSMLQYSSRSTQRATAELCRFFRASTVEWKPCQWWSNVAFMCCFSSSLLIRLKINNAYTTLVLSFLEGPGKLLFFSIFFEQGAATLAGYPSALWNDKNCTPEGALAHSAAVLKQHPWWCATQRIHWKQLLTTASALLWVF